MSSPRVVARAYRLLDKIAVGGSGVIYRAAPLERGRLVALKLMHAEHPEGDTERERFSREAKIIKELEHPHIVQMLDFGHTEQGVPFLVFPLLQGRTLHARLEAEGKLSWGETGRLSAQVLSALEMAHGRDIVHRDIKPPNIFLVPSARHDHVQLLDFGLAKALSRKSMSEVTRIGAVIGTPRYMAPEQVRGERVGHAADIYSTGLIMAEMLLGLPLVKDDKVLEIYMWHGSDREHELPDEVLRSPFAGIIRRAVAKPIDVRYARASQMLADVRAVLEGLHAGSYQMAGPDLETTQVIDPEAQPARQPSEMSDKLRDAFNVMVERAAAAEASAPDAATAQRHAAERAALEQAAAAKHAARERAARRRAEAAAAQAVVRHPEPPKRALPLPAESSPLLLTKRSEPEIEDDETWVEDMETQRIRRGKLPE